MEDALDTFVRAKQTFQFEDWKRLYERFVAATGAAAAGQTIKPLKHVLRSDTRSIGSYSSVFVDVDVDEPCVVKIPLQSTLCANVGLFSEAVVHAYVQTRSKSNHVVRMIKCAIMLVDGETTVCVFLEKMDSTLCRFFGHPAKTKMLETWRSQIHAELDALNARGIFHRDAHVGNIGVVNGTWKLFDFGMSRVVLARTTNQEPYCEEGFYEIDDVVVCGHDARVFEYSWHMFGKCSMAPNVQDMVRTPATQWRKYTPVVDEFGNSVSYVRIDGNVFWVRCEHFLYQTTSCTLDLMDEHLMYYFAHLRDDPTRAQRPATAAPPPSTTPAVATDAPPAEMST